MSLQQIRERIEQSWDSGEVDQEAVGAALAALDRGEVRVAEKKDGEWVVNAWLKQAILLYFRTAKMAVGSYGDYTFHDKVPLKKDIGDIRIVPPEPGVTGRI